MLRQTIENYFIEIFKDDIKNILDEIKAPLKGVENKKGLYKFLHSINNGDFLEAKFTIDDFEYFKNCDFISFELFLKVFIQSGGADPDFMQLTELALKLDSMFKTVDEGIMTSRDFIEYIYASVDYENLINLNFFNQFDEVDNTTLFSLGLLFFISKIDAFLFKNFFPIELDSGINVRPISFGWVMMKQLSPLKYRYNGERFIKLNNHKALFTNPNLVLTWVLKALASFQKNGVFPVRIYACDEFFDVLDYQFIENEKYSKSDFFKNFKEGSKPISLFKFLSLLEDSEYSFEHNFKKLKIKFNFNLDEISLSAKDKNLNEIHIYTLFWFVYRFFYFLYHHSPNKETEYCGFYYLFWMKNLSTFGLVVDNDADYAEWPEEIRELARFR